MEPSKQRWRIWLANKYAKVAVIVLPVGVAVVIAIRDTLVSDCLDGHILAPLGGWWKRFVAQPTGATLVLFLFAVLLLLAIALIDTSPNGVLLQSFNPWRKDKKPKELSVHERYELDCVRKMWLGESQQACERAISGVESAERVLDRRGNKLAGLLDTQIVRLRQAMNALESGFHNGERRAEIEKRFAEVRVAYGQCACSYNKCLLVDATLLEDNQTFFKVRELQQWAHLHSSFASAIETLTKYDGLNSFCAPLPDDLYNMRSLDDESGFQLVVGLAVKSR